MFCHCKLCLIHQLAATLGTISTWVRALSYCKCRKLYPLFFFFFLKNKIICMYCKREHYVNKCNYVFIIIIFITFYESLCILMLYICVVCCNVLVYVSKMSVLSNWGDFGHWGGYGQFFNFRNTVFVQKLSWWNIFYCKVELSIFITW